MFLGTRFSNVAGIYAVYTANRWLDIGQTDQLGIRMNGGVHERQKDWVANSMSAPIFIAFLPMDNEQSRINLESSLRQILQPLCGDR